MHKAKQTIFAALKACNFTLYTANQHNAEQFVSDECHENSVIFLPKR